MERGWSRTVAGLVRRAGICFCGAVRANGKNAKPGAAEKPTVPGAGGQDHRTAAQRRSADQRHVADHRDVAALRRFSVLSDDVSPGASEWRCFLSLLAAAHGSRHFVVGLLVIES